ncbi:MAG TPA: hypothetical protein VGI58_16830 [Streptosporangiaceae bacterium]|jgi:hypothetical protein
MKLPPDPPTGTDVMVTQANPLYGHDAPLIRLRAASRLSPPTDADPVTAAIARHIGESGCVYLELPDGRLTVVLELSGKRWIPQAREEGSRG